MIILRPVNLPADREALLRLNTAFRTTQIYQVTASTDSFSLRESPVAPPVTKSFPLDDELDDDHYWQAGIVAEHMDVIVGFLALRYEEWNRRAVIWHLYVDDAQRGLGLGRRLIEAADHWAQQHGARCLWLEVTNVNAPAIRFYRRMGFIFCGLDNSLYDPAGDAGGEVALYFMRLIPELNTQ